MTSRIRFTTGRSVFDAFSDLKWIAPPPTDDVAALDYARRLLAAPNPSASIAFMAHVLPRREAIWWARQCVGAILGPRAEDASMRVAEDWVRAPEEERRRAALELGAAADQKLPTTWLALAVAWSGGSLISSEHNPVTPPPSSCAKAVNAAIMLAVCMTEPTAMKAWIAACVEAGIRFAEGGEAKLDPPKLAADRSPVGAKSP